MTRQARSGNEESQLPATVPSARQTFAGKNSLTLSQFVQDNTRGDNYQLASEAIVTKEEAIAELRKLDFAEEDAEARHIKADAVLCEFLNSLGYGDVVAEFKNGSKQRWYG